MKKKRDYERRAVALFLICVFLICGVLLLRDPRVISYATKEKSIEIMNKQSYSAVNNIWTIRFVTEGKGDLEIGEIKDAFYDLSRPEIKCGEEIFNYELEGSKITVKDYECEQIGSATTEIRREGIQTLKMTFGNKAYASNIAITKEKI